MCEFFKCRRQIDRSGIFIVAVIIGYHAQEDVLQKMRISDELCAELFVEYLLTRLVQKIEMHGNDQKRTLGIVPRGVFRIRSE